MLSHVGTSLLNPPPSPSSVAEGFGNIGKAAHIVKIIIMAHEWLFDPIVEAEPTPVETEETARVGHSDSEQASTSSVPSGATVSAPVTNDVEPGSGNVDSNKDSIPSSSPANRAELSVVQPEPSSASAYVDAAACAQARDEEKEELADDINRIDCPLSPPSALGLQLADNEGERTIAGTLSGGRNLPRREQEESIYLDAQDALEMLSFNLEEPVSLASPLEEIDDPMQQLHTQLNAIGKTP
ncbi:hypothetical protein K437DRAFT_119599 [Tilletiaria anomala UBC 951]|uniref:Uncharacterized protein n=1 Tax=Tilletiaria anomala (strain ATCC 24038 / CBS 436.72 / UBC 951) TaxID=1037660 RepID=A0A066VWA8_TILAU|nr:uncharacterized protein K437DRAFT_119599 [Tilletiaria anomala UBC 951]KDN45761.1 hypothetical protein K437DRAFT_119599 [Tilletiaria anomala UBC 951]